MHPGYDHFLLTYHVHHVWFPQEKLVGEAIEHLQKSHCILQPLEGWVHVSHSRQLVVMWSNVISGFAWFFRQDCCIWRCEGLGRQEICWSECTFVSFLRSHLLSLASCLFMIVLRFWPWICKAMNSKQTGVVASPWTLDLSLVNCIHKGCSCNSWSVTLVLNCGIRVLNKTCRKGCFWPAIDAILCVPTSAYHSEHTMILLLWRLVVSMWSSGLGESPEKYAPRGQKYNVGVKSKRIHWIIGSWNKMTMWPGTFHCIIVDDSVFLRWKRILKVLLWVRLAMCRQWCM